MGWCPRPTSSSSPARRPTRELAIELFRFLRLRLAPYQRVRRLEFSDLPKTISGKIRRVELRKRELQRGPSGARGEREFWQDDFPELK